MAESDVKKQLKTFEQQLKSAETSSFDEKIGGYKVKGVDQVFSRVELEQFKRNLRDVLIPQAQAGLRAAKQAGVTSPTPSKPVFPEKVRLVEQRQKIAEITAGDTSFENVYKLAVAYRDLVDMIDQGYVDPATGQRTQWADRDKMMGPAAKSLDAVTNSLKRLTVAGGTYRTVVSGKGAAATRRSVLDQTPAEAAETDRREKIYADFVAGRDAEFVERPERAPGRTAGAAAAGVSTAGQFRMAEEAAGEPSAATMAEVGRIVSNIRKGKKTKTGGVTTPAAGDTETGGGGGGGTGGGGTGGTETGGGGGGVTEPSGSSVEWLQDAYREYGWVASLYESNDSIRTLLDWSRKNIDPTTAEGRQRFLNELYKTSWWNNTSSAMRNYTKLKANPEWTETLADKTEEMRGTADGKGLTLSNETLARLAEESIKNGWSDTETDRAIGAEWVKESQRARAGGLVTPQMDITRTAEYADLKRVTSQLMLDNIADDELTGYTERIIKGETTADAFRKDMKARAKLRYGALSNYIDQDYDIRSVTADYRKTAASLLELPEDKVNFTDSKFYRAFAFDPQNTGTPRQMNLNEWEQYIRSLPDWQKTENAKREYRDVGMSLLKYFGKVQ